MFHFYKNAKKKNMYTLFTDIKKYAPYFTRKYEVLNVIVSKSKEEMKSKLGEIYKYFS